MPMEWSPFVADRIHGLQILIYVVLYVDAENLSP